MIKFIWHIILFYIIVYKKGYIIAIVKKLFSLDSSIAKELEVVAKAMNSTQKDAVEKALDFYFDYTDALVVDKIFEDIYDKKISTYSKKEVYDILGI